MDRFAGDRGRRWQLAALGASSLAGYWIAAVVLETYGAARDVLQFLGLFGGLFAIYFLAVALARGAEGSPRVTFPILAWALLFRLALLPAGLPTGTWLEDLGSDLRSAEVSYRSFLLYDNDVWRYLWDGHVFGSGLDPYARSPSELEITAESGDPEAVALFKDELWQDVFDRVSYQSYRTVYPPVAQWLFRLHHAVLPGSVLIWKLMIALFDFGTCLILLALLRQLGGRPAYVVLYAWNPLVVKELAGSGHVDAVMIFFLVLSIYLIDRGRRRRGFAALGLAAYGLAVLSKLTPILLVGLYLRRARPRSWWVLAATLTAGYLPFLGSLEAMVQGILAFSREWVFNPGPWLLVKWAAERGLGLDGPAVARAVSLAVTVALVAWSLRRDDGGTERLISGGFLVLGGFLVFSAAVMPWYLLWVLPFATVRAGTTPGGESRPEVFAWMVLTLSSLLSYLIYIDQIEHRWWLWLEYLAFFGVLAWGLRRRRAAAVSS